MATEPMVLETVILPGARLFERLDRYIAMEKYVTPNRDTVYHAVINIMVNSVGEVHLHDLVTPNGTSVEAIRPLLEEMGRRLISMFPEMACMEVCFNSRICNDIIFTVVEYEVKPGFPNPRFI